MRGTSGPAARPSGDARMTKAAAILAAVLAAANVDGCAGRPTAAPTPRAPAVQRDPTPEWPIVVAFAEPETLLIFGGPDGSFRRRLPQPKGFCIYAFSPSGRRAATLTAPDPGKVLLSVYDESGGTLVRAEMPLPGKGLPSGRAWISDAAEALVFVKTWLPVDQLARESATHMDPNAPLPVPIGVRTYFVRANGAVVELDVPPPAEALFPKSPGVAILAWEEKVGQEADSPQSDAVRPYVPVPGEWKLLRLGADLEILWKREIPTDYCGYPHLWWHSQRDLPPGVDFVLERSPFERWDFRLDGQAVRRPRSVQWAWCAATSEVGHPILEGRTVKLAIHTQQGKYLRTVEVAEVSTGWFVSAAWLGAAGHVVAAVWEVEYSNFGWPPPEPERRYAGTWYVEPDGRRLRLDVAAPLAGGVWADGSYALLLEEEKAFVLRAWDAAHRPTWTRTYQKQTADGRPVRGMHALMDAGGILTLQQSDGDQRTDLERLTAIGNVLRGE